MNTCTLLSLYLIVSVNGQYQISDITGVGRQFDGIGGLSGGGATSKLLVSYPEPQRSHILDLLFKPQYGAALQILKVEIGGDAQTTDGSESSHMHTENEENYNRGYEWWLMKEAKMRNPNIALWGLPWAFPGWVGDYGSTPYKNITKAANYIVNWVKGARDVHNLTIDFIGIWNERTWDNSYILELRSVLNQNQLQSVKIVAPDSIEFYPLDYTGFTQNASVFNALHAIGVHYPGTQLPENTRMSSLPLWSSEDYSTFNDDVGAGCWARILNQNYVNGNMTSTIAWNLITSYYSGLPYPRNGLMDAMQPWTGSYVVQDPIWVTAHTTHFTNVGWHYLKHGSGSGLLRGGGSYVSLTDGQNLTIIIETMSHDHSICVRPKLPAYIVIAQNITFTVLGSFYGIPKLYVYKTQFRYDNQSSQVFEKQDDYTIIDHTINLQVEPDCVYTLSTVYSPDRVQENSIPAPQPFPLPYSENFDTYDMDNEPKYLAQQNGAWEIVKTSTESFARQKTISRPIEWCPAPLPGTSAVIGDSSWQALPINVSIKVRSPAVNGARKLFVALKMSGLGCQAHFTSGIFLWLMPNTTTYSISYDLYSLTTVKSGQLSAPISFDTWHSISLSTMGNTMSAQINADYISAPFTGSTMGGFVGIGSSDYGYSDWDDLMIYEVPEIVSSIPTTKPTTLPTTTQSTTSPPTQPTTSPTPTVTQSTGSPGASCPTAGRPKLSTTFAILALILIAKLW
uniref:galactosylceramidase n=1 Tax=Plectus sambesii TaxID=2011161 RepID=A0A914V3T9_9BILA